MPAGPLLGVLFGVILVLVLARAISYASLFIALLIVGGGILWILSLKALRRIRRGDEPNVIDVTPTRRKDEPKPRKSWLDWPDG